MSDHYSHSPALAVMERIGDLVVGLTAAEWRAQPLWERVALNTLFWREMPVSVHHHTAC